MAGTIWAYDSPFDTGINANGNPGGPGGPGGGPGGGDPIDLSTGDFYYNHSDMNIPAPGIPLDLVRWLPCYGYVQRPLWTWLEYRISMAAN